MRVLAKILNLNPCTFMTTSTSEQPLGQPSETALNYFPLYRQAAEEANCHWDIFAERGPDGTLKRKFTAAEGKRMSPACAKILQPYREKAQKKAEQDRKEREEKEKAMAEAKKKADADAEAEKQADETHKPVLAILEKLLEYVTQQKADTEAKQAKQSKADEKKEAPQPPRPIPAVKLSAVNERSAHDVKLLLEKLGVQGVAYVTANFRRSGAFTVFAKDSDAAAQMLPALEKAADVPFGFDKFAIYPPKRQNGGGAAAAAADGKREKPNQQSAKAQQQKKPAKQGQRGGGKPAAGDQLAERMASLEKAVASLAAALEKQKPAAAEPEPAEQPKPVERQPAEPAGGNGRAKRRGVCFTYKKNGSCPKAGCPFRHS
jgi:hypothetical protein